MTDAELEGVLHDVRESVRKGLAAHKRIPASAWIFGTSEIATLMFATKQEILLAVRSAIMRVHGHVAVVVQGLLVEGQPAYAVEWRNAWTGTEGATVQRVTWHPFTGVVFANAEPHPSPIPLSSLLPLVTSASDSTHP